jgi:hypothetical protein
MGSTTNRIHSFSVTWNGLYPVKSQSNLLSSKHGYKLAQLYVTRIDNYGKAKMNRYQPVLNIEKLESILDIYLILFMCDFYT